jgi:DNA polymerase-4
MHERPVRDVPGIGRKTAELLRQVNIGRVYELKRFPVGYLEKIFGKTGFLIYERLRGRDPYVPALLPKTISRETSFHRDTTDEAEVTAMLYYLVERACRTARGLSLVPSKVQVRVRYGDGAFETAGARLGETSVLDAAIFRMARELLRRIYRRCSVHLIGTTLAGLYRVEHAQGELYEQRGREKLSSLYGTLDRIRSRFGHSSVIAGQSINLMDRLERDSYGYVLRTPSLTK